MPAKTTPAQAKTLAELSAAYEAERQRIDRLRLETWSSATGREVCGVFLLPLTMRAWIDLRAAGNSLVIGGEVSGEAITQYYWRNCADYDPGHRWRIRRAKRRLSRALWTHPPDAVLQGAIDHCEHAFMESPPAPPASGVQISETSPVPDFVYAVEEVVAICGQNPDAVMDWPLAQLFAVQYAHRLRTVEKYPKTDPAPLRRLSGKILEAMNGPLREK